ncbi:MAG: ArgE/DapE family deacylase [Candidatus Bathyarchaeota archaeon]|nr:MAG: ArgE/DapE family deacylase [Candidatus Bathyarchaeota archaeon]
MLPEKESRVLGLIDENKQEIIEYLQKLISFKTVTPQDNTKVEGDDSKGLQNFVRNTLEEMSFSVDMWEVVSSELKSFPGSGDIQNRDLSNMPVLVGKLEGNGKGKSLILNGHYDVVPEGIVENWKHDPFKGEIEDSKIFGRGANDMKGGIAAMLHAVKFIQEAGVRIGGDLTVQTVPDEEATCMGTLACCQRGYTADAAIIPEPTDMKVLVAMRGSLYGKITVFGRAGHAELTQPHWSEGGAVNAISKAMKVIAALEELTDEWRTRPDKRHKFLDPDIIIPTVISGGKWQVTYPEKVEIQFGSIFVPGTRNKRQEIEEKLRNVANNDSWMKEHPPKLEAEEWSYGAEVDENEPIVKMGMAVLRDLGFEPALAGFGSLTDAVHLVNYSKIPTISIGPDYKSAHMADEFVEIEQLINTTKALALAIMRWCE